MKKQLLLLVTLISMISVFGQKIDKDLIFGKWKAYSLITPKLAVNTDSLQSSKKAMENAAVANSLSHTLGLKDSLKIAHDVIIIGKKIDSSYVQFNKNGTYVSYVCFAEGENAEKTEGTFKWYSDSEISLSHESSTEIIRVKKLTSKLLSIAGNESKPDETFHVGFKRIE